jgi:hypothetical protein
MQPYSPWSFAEGQGCCHISVMAIEAPLPITPIYRLVVTASQLKAKQFVWVIVNDSFRGAPIQTSKRTFRSMEDAYNAGRDALAYWQQKARRANPAVDLAQPPPAKKTTDRAAKPT